MRPLVELIIAIIISVGLVLLCGGPRKVGPVKEEKTRPEPVVIVEYPVPSIVMVFPNMDDPQFIIRQLGPDVFERVEIDSKHYVVKKKEYCKNG